MQSVNGPQFLNITHLFHSSNRFALSFALALLIVEVPLTSIYASLQLHKRDFNIEVLTI